MNIKLIATDLDRTLLRSDKTVSDYTYDILRRCQEKGIGLVFSTLRPVRTCHFHDDLRPNYILANNGATIWDGKTVLHDRFIPRDTVKGLVDILLKTPEIAVISADAGDRMLTDSPDREWDKRWNPVYYDFSVPLDLETVKLSVECANADLIADIVGLFPDVSRYCSTGEIWHIIVHSEATKLNALHLLGEKLGIGFNEMAAFGDDYVDVPMLMHCGTGVAVTNAISEAKAAADSICASNDEDGVARWIEEYILNK